MGEKSFMRFHFAMLCLCALPLFAQEKPADTAKNTKPKPSAPKQFYTKEYQMLIFEAMRSFQVHDYKSALALTEKAEALMPPTPMTWNVRGAVAIEMRQFEEGEKYCQQALKLNRFFFPARYNLCEIPFLKGEYAEARKMWQALYGSYRADYPAFTKEDEMPELLIYRITIAFLLEKDFVHAKDWLEKIPFPSVTPAYQYAHAAWEHETGDRAKWEEWLKSARFIWPDAKRTNFVDVLVQLKWLKDDAETAEKLGEKTEEKK